MIEVFKDCWSEINFIFLDNLTVKPCGKIGRPSVAAIFKICYVVVEFRNVYKEFRCWFIMNRKKFLVIGLLGLFVISMFAVVMAAETVDAVDAAAAGEKLGAEAKSVGAGIAAFFKALFGDVGTGSSEWLSMVFFALLLGMFIYTALESFFGLDNKYIVWGSTIAATGLAMIAMPPEYLTALRTNYGAMGLTILAVIPFIIILAFTVKIKNRAIARGTWLIYTLYYFWLYMAILIEPGKEIASRAPYVLAIIAGVLMFLTIGWIRIWKSGEELSNMKESAKAGLKKKRLNRQIAIAHEEAIAEDAKRSSTLDKTSLDSSKL